VADFGKAVAAWSEKTGESVDDIVVATVMDLTRRVIRRTPVGNPDLWKSSPPEGYTGGQAKGNWIASIGEPSAGVFDGVTAKNASKPMQWAMPSIQRAPDNVYYLVNNLPYVVALEYGWSDQAPQGMVRLTVAEFNQSIEKAISKHKGR
jgi:hypothetical protein